LSENAEPALAGLMAAVEAGHTILAPNTELAAALYDAVERHYRAAGLKIWATPRVRDFGGWLRDQHVQAQLTDSTSPRALSDIEESELWRILIEAGESGPHSIEPAAAVRAARRARRTLYEYGIPLRAVAEQGAGSEETEAFLDWNRQFDARCREIDCIGADELLGRARPAAAPLRWIDSPGWRPTARQWLERHGERLPPPFNVSRRTSVLHAASPAAEFAAIADWARVNLRDESGFRAWVCIPDLSQRRGEIVDAMDAALAPQRFSVAGADAPAPYAVAGGTPLEGYTPVRAALSFLDASEGAVPFERFSVLLRAPEWHESTADAGAAALADVLLRTRGPSEADLSSWIALTEKLARVQGTAALAAVQRMRGALRELEEPRGAQALSRWVRAWVRGFEAGPWALRRRWSSTEYQAAERFRELLGQLAAADSFFGTLSRRTALSLLRRAARETAFQVKTGVPAIWVSGQLIDPWLNYDGIWVSGCGDDKWPPAAQPIAFLPVRLQREYSVIGAASESQLQSALELQSRWAARAALCVYSYSDSGDGRPGSQSPLLPASAAPAPTGASVTARPVIAPLPAVPQPHWHALLEAAPPLERLADEIAPPFGAGERTRGVSTLKSQSRCAFRGFAETRLKTLRLERPVPGFNDRERGDLLHHALEHIWSVLRNSDQLASISSERQAQLLDDAVVQALSKICRVRDPGARWRERERERMHNVLGKWLTVERRRAPFEVEYLEQGAQVARHAGLEFSVRIDRVDRLSDGSRVLIDYKTGIAAADWRGERPDNPQLPIYALLYPEALVAVAYGRVNAAECGFVAETERRDIFYPRSRQSSLEGLPSLAALIEVWAKRIDRLAADFSAGRAAVAPTAKACKSCSLHGLCRVPAALEDADSPV
jgi:probable DNA repair protein